MPVIPEPFAPAAERLGIGQEQLLAHLEQMRERRLLRRVAAILYHRRAGFSANGMGVWKVPDEQITELGPRMAAFRGISHCYQRPTYADWPYSIFTMAHGRSKDECDAILGLRSRPRPRSRTVRRCTPRLSTRRFWLLYFTDDYRAWERRHAGVFDSRSSERPTCSARSCTNARSACFPGGVNSARPGDAVDRSRPDLHRPGRGLEDLRRRRQRVAVDWVSSWGPLIVGHAHTAVVDAVVETTLNGTSFGAPTKGEVDLAIEVASRVPSVAMLRMTSSGTEATMSAIRLARAATAREPVLKFAGAYHGHVDGLLAEAGSGLATQGIPSSPGVLEAATSATVIVPLERRGGAQSRRPSCYELAGDPR